MEFTIKELLEANAALTVLTQQKVRNAQKEERKLAYKMKRNMDYISSATREYEFNRQELVVAYAEKDVNDKIVTEDGKVQFSDENKREFQEKIAEEQSEIVQAELRPFSEKEIQIIVEKYDLSLQFLAYLECVIEE